MRVALLALTLLAVAGAASAQSVADQFQRLERTSNGVTIKYGLFVPDGYDSAQSYPIVVALHGNGERANAGGTDDLRNIAAHGLATTWAEPALQAEHPAFVFAPQVPNDPQYRWSAERDPDNSSLIGIQLTTLEILDAIEAEYNIDPDRVYVVGLSMGGHGTWDLISRLEGRFAAAAPMSGESFVSQADDIAHIPVWAFSGEQDPASLVPPWETRRIVQAMEDLGRDVIYTHCRRSPLEPTRAFDCPGAIGRDSLAAAIDAHADLIYTSEADLGHGPWRPWFENPLLAEWLYSKVRQDVDAVTIGAPSPGDSWDGTQTVTWSTTRTTEDTVEVWLNPTDDPTDWRKLGEAPIADGALAVDLGGLPEAAGARVRLWVRNADGRIAGRATSEPFAIDRAATNAAPELRLDDEALRFAPRLTAESFDLSFIAADAEGGSLTADVFYSVDGGETYTALLTTVLSSSSAEPQSVALDVAALPNTQTARFRVDLSDGSSTVSAETATFLKQTPRAVNTFVQQVQGEGEGAIELHFVDPSALTGHRYRITIDASDPDAKTYAVVDLDESETVLSGVPLSDGLAESPVFDGMALVVEDLDEGRADLDATGWVEGDTDLGVAVSGGTVRVSILTIDLLATETDYDLTITADVAGESTSIYNLPARPRRFTVTGADGQPRAVAFKDANADGLPGSGDLLYILEPDAEGELELAWELRFTDGDVAPEAGDTFRLVPVRSLATGDAFEFEARVNTAAEAAPGAALDLRAFPNPFAGALTVAYDLGAPGTVRVEVFDALGRLVARLADGPAPASGRLSWDARGAAPGVYVVRLTAEADGAAPASARRTVVLTR